MTAFVAVFRQLYCVSAAKTDAGRPSSFSRYRVSTVNTYAYVCDKLSEIKMDAFVSKLKNNPIKYRGTAFHVERGTCGFARLFASNCREKV